MNTLLALVIATAVLVTIPGSNVALIVANSLKFGFRSGLVTVLGTTMGLGLQLALVVAGMTVVIELAADALGWIRWAGAAYLVWLGVKTWRTPADDITAVRAEPVMLWRGCLVAAANPKTLMFNVAFIPQFVGTGGVTALAPTTVLVSRCRDAEVRPSARRRHLHLKGKQGAL